MNEILRTIARAFMPPSEGFLALGLIAVIVAWAIMILLRVRKYLQHERARFANCRQAVQDAVENGQDVEDVVRNWLKDVDCQADHNQRDPDSLTKKAVQAILAAETSPIPDLEAVSTMLEQSESHRLSGPRHAPNWLLLAGIFGTVLGLAGAVGTLGPQIQSTVQTSNPIALTERLGETLKQMQAAFACTLWGVLSAVLISTFTRRIGAQQGELLAQIQQLVLYELAPRLLPQSQESQLKDIRRVLAQSKGFIKDVSKVLTQSAQEFKIILNETGNKMAEIGTQLQETTESVQTTLSTVADNVKASATALQSSTEEVRKSAENLREAHTDLKQTYEDLLQRFDKSRTELEEQIQKQLTTIDDWRKELTRSAGEIAERVDTSSQNLKEATREFKNTGEVYRSTNHDLLQKMESGFQKMNEDTGTLFEEHRKEMGRVDAGLREIGERLRELYERLDPRLVPVGEWERLRNAWEGISKYLQSRIDGGIATTVSESHNGFHPELVEALKDLNARLEILQQRPLNLQVERLAEIAENLRTLNEQLSNVLGLVGDLDEISAEAKAFETQGNSEPPESDQPPGEQAIVQMVSMPRDEKEG